MIKHRKIIISFVAGMIFLAIALHGYTIYGANQRLERVEINQQEILKWIKNIIEQNQ